MNLLRAREFLLGAYHDLPNVLFTGSLLIGSMTGYLSLIWVAVGMILVAVVVSLLQGGLSLVYPNWSQVVVPAGSLACEIIRRVQDSGATTVIAPSYWLSATSFFAMFLIYNSIRVAIRPPADGVDATKVDARRAFSLSVLLTGIAFFFLVLLRGYSGCESWLGGILGVLVGSGVAIGYWHLLDACDSGIIPDILQVVGSMAPAGSDATTPIVCTPPPPNAAPANARKN